MAPHLLLSEVPIRSLIMLLICVVAMLMTYSRSGVVLSFMALGLAFFGFFYRDLQRRRWVAAGLVIEWIGCFSFARDSGGQCDQSA